MTSAGKVTGRPWLTALPLAVIPALWLSLLVIMFERWPGVSYNSDLLQPFMVLSDFYGDPSAVLDWYHSPAPYVFPDWLLAALVVPLPLKADWWPVIYGAISISLLCLAMGWAVSLGTSRSLVSTTWMATGALAGAAILLWLTGPPPVGMVWMWLASPFVHGGAVLAAIAAVALLLRLLDEDTKPRRWAYAALLFASSFSDLAFVIWFAAPAAIMLGLSAWTEARGDRLRLAAWTLGSAFAGAAVCLLMAHSTSQPVGGVAAILPAIRAAVLITHDSVNMGDLGAVAVCVGLVAVVLRAAYLLLRATMSSRRLTHAQWIEVLIAGMSAATVLAPLAAGWATTVGDFRYFMPLPVLLLLWLTLLIARFPIDRIGISLWAPAACVAAIVAFSGTAQSAAERLVKPLPLQTCLEAEGRRDGFGDYWTAKWLMMRSDFRIHVIQLTSEGHPYRWNFNERWFTHRAGDGEPARPDFVDTNRLDLSVVRGLFGEPARTVDCGEGHVIWLYDRVLPLPE